MRPSAYERIVAHLQPGERLLWYGRPVTGFRLRRQELFGAVLIAVVLGVLLVVIFVLIAQGEGGPAIIPSVIAFVIGYAVFRGTVVDTRRRGRSAYGLTDRRVIVLGDPKDWRNWSLPLASLSDITLRERKDGAGSIVCFSTVPDWNRPTKRKGLLPRPLMVSIVDVRHVHDLLLDARSRAAQPLAYPRS